MLDILQRGHATGSDFAAFSNAHFKKSTVCSEIKGILCSTVGLPVQIGKTEARLNIHD